MKRIFTISVLLNLLCALQAQTPVPAIIDKLLILDQSQSPYLITENTQITETGELQISKGVTVLMAANLSFMINGRLVINGSEKNPVVFKALNSGERWKYFYNNGTFIADDLIVTDAVRLVTSHGDTVIVKDTKVSNTFGGVGDDLIGVHDAKKVVIKRCYFEGNPASGKTDAIDVDGIHNDTIVDNVIFNFSDDGLDIGTYSSNIYVAGNTIYNCDMGISVGESSTAYLYQNILYNNTAGIQSHKGSNVTAVNNTLHQNTEGLRLLHNVTETTSGGTLSIENSIIEGCKSLLIRQVANSTLSINYCLSDSIISVGTGNKQGKASFANPAIHNYLLQKNSPAIDAGNPDANQNNANYTTDIFDQDSDGTRKDLGYQYFHQRPFQINEIVASNLTAVRDEFNLLPDMVELKNNTAQNINLKGYSISDDKNDPFKHIFTQDLILPANGMLMLYPDNLEKDTTTHLPFKLSGGGERLMIIDPTHKVIDELKFDIIPVDKAYGRSSISNQWLYFNTPSPKAENPAEGLLAVCDDPSFSVDGGASDFPVTTLISGEENSQIHYSLDGTAPFSGVPYAAPITIDKATTVRAIANDSTKLPSFATSRFFFPSNEGTKKVLSISTDNDNLFGSKGIHVNYALSGPFWERPVSLSFYDKDFKYESTAGLRIQGGNSVSMAKKSFRVFFRGGYGDSRMGYSPFLGGPKSFENIVLRAGYDDDITTSTGTLIRDPFSAELWGMLGETATKSDWASLYINNEYRGLYNIRESVNEIFVEDHLNIKNFDLVRFLKYGCFAKYGTKDAWNEMDAFFKRTDFSQPGTYEQAAAYLDMNSFLNLLSFVHCAQYRSWTWGAFGIKPENKKWTWTIWDTDRAYTDLNWNGFTQYASTSAEKWPNIYPQKLLKNEQFKVDLINRTCDLLNETFKPENSIAVFDSIKTVIEPEMDKEIARWNGSRTRWENNCTNIRSFLTQRPAVVHQQMLSYFKIANTINVKIKIIGSGSVKLNSLLIKDKEWDGTYMAGIPIDLVAVPGFGMKFVRWQEQGTEAGIQVNKANDVTLTAIFEKDEESVAPLVITEIMYHPLTNQGGEWIELYNPNKFAVNLAGYLLKDGGANNRFVFPEGTKVDPENFIIVCGNQTDFNDAFALSLNTIGNFNDGLQGFSLSNGGDQILLLDQDSVLVDSVLYSDNYPWPTFADGSGASLQLKHYTLDNSLPYNWVSTISTRYSPGETNVISKISETKSSLAILAYPNPFGNLITIRLEGKPEGKVNFTLYDVSGRMMDQKQDVEMQGDTFEYPYHLNLKKGIYFLQIRVEGKTERYSETLKLIRQ